MTDTASSSTCPRGLHEGPAAAARFGDFIRETSFPCVGAKAALAHEQIEVIEARDIRSAWDDLDIHAALTRFAVRYRRDPRPFQSLAVVFAGPDAISEDAFETALWARLQSLADKDAFQGYLHDPRVSEDVANPHFGLSFGEEAFFVVGLHPGASRPARRFHRPAMVFNPHDQFETLRADGRYDILREKIIARDVAVAGTPNPMLARHGETSEARQYSGRRVAADWIPPFRAKATKASNDP